MCIPSWYVFLWMKWNTHVSYLIFVYYNTQVNIKYNFIIYKATFCSITFYFRQSEEAGLHNKHNVIAIVMTPTAA